MKKIFSFMLIAAGLLISGQVKAATPVGSQAELQSAINNCAAGSSVDITVTQSFDVENLPIYMLGTKAEGSALRTINLNLNGNTISSALTSTFEVFKGVLNISGGTISNTNAAGTAIVMHGTYDAFENWSTLVVGKDASVISAYNAITLMEFDGLKYYKFGDKSYAGQDAYSKDRCAYKFAKNDAGDDKDTNTGRDETLAEPTKTGNSLWAHKCATDAEFTFDYTSTAKIYKDEDKSVAVTKAGKRHYAETVAKSYANGVKITIDGYVKGEKYGYKTNGTFKNVCTYPPTIFVSKTATVACATEPLESLGRESIAIYSSGVSNITIEGYVTGSMGICVKGGNVTLNDAVVEATGSDHTPLTKSASGVDGGTGSAIVVLADKSYAGGQSVTINGDTKITAEAGYAIEEAVVGQQNEPLKDITINSAIIQGGELGAVLVMEQDTSKVTVYGGSIEGVIATNAEEKTMQDFVPDGYTSDNIGTPTEPIYVITQGDPVETTKDINDVTEGEDARLSASENMVMNNSMSVGVLYITEGTKLVIADGKTLAAKKIVMGTADQIVVPYNGKLIITGNEGLYAHDESNIILQAKGDTLATLIFKFSVAQNKQPFATIEYNATAKQLADGGHKWNRLAMPFESLTDYRTVNKSTIEKYGTKWSTSFQVWDPVTGWSEAEYDENKNPILAAFQGLALSNVSKNGDAKYEFKGMLQGVKQGTLVVEEGWNYYGNSFTAPMDLNELLSKLPVKAIKLWNAKKQKYVDVTYPHGRFGSIKELPALQSFMFQATKAETVDLDYKKLIWDYNVTEE